MFRMRGPSMLMGIAATVLVVHGAFAMLGVYAVFPWMDNLIHASGGAWGALVGYWLLTDARWRRRWGAPSRRLIALAIFGVAAVVGIAWEILEFVVLWLSATTAEMLQFTSASVGDMVSDLSADLVGALAVGMGVVRGRRVRRPSAAPRSPRKKRARRARVSVQPVAVGATSIPPA
ncbi:hypothetical protein HYV74_04465 [Candidatus Uhrbacteria bacterium]|nr:hypothetical protein [Candidatus Uhrbacteria bacterium]